MKDNFSRVNVPIAVYSLLISVFIFWIVLPERLSKRLRPIRVALSVEGLDAKHFYIAKQPADIVVKAEVTDEEYKSFSGVATAVAELYGASPGKNMYPVSLSPRGLRGILRDTNLQAEFTIEALKSREVPVIVSTSGKLIDPTEIVDNMKPDPKKATIDGPADNVARVVSARATLRLDMLDPHAGQQQVNLDPVDKDDRVVENVDIHPSQVIVTPQFSLAPQHKQVFVEALFTDAQVPEGYAVKSYSIDPSRVTASGSGQALLHIAKVSTEKIDLSKMTTTQTLTVPLKTVSNDITITPSTVQITIIIEPIALKGLSPKISPTGSSTSKPGGTSPGL